MPAAIAPASEAELVEVLRGATVPFELTGLATKRQFGRPAGATQALSLAKFSGIGLYEPEELVISAAAATPLADIEAVLAAKDQQLAFEPPDLSAMFDAASSGSIGGVLACNLSGPRRLKAGAARDHILGVTAVSGRGEAFKAGARVMKNVTGYDLPKLMAGSFGTLAAITSVTFKVMPRPETEETLLVPRQSAGQAVATMSAAMQSSAEVSAAAHVPGIGTLLRLEGIAPSVAYRRDRLRAQLDPPAEVLAEAQSRAMWRRVRDVRVLDCEAGDCLWRISVAPSEAPSVVSAFRGGRWFMDWAGGLIWFAAAGFPDGGAAMVRAAFATGHASLVRAPAEIRAQVAVLQPQPPPLAALTARVKAAFDPQGLLNPGRMYGTA